MNLHVVVEVAVDFRHVRGADAARRLGVAQANPPSSRAVRSTRCRSRRWRVRRRLPGRGAPSTASPGRAGNVAHGSGVTRRRGRSAACLETGRTRAGFTALCSAQWVGVPVARGARSRRPMAGCTKSSRLASDEASRLCTAPGGRRGRGQAPRFSSPTGGRGTGRVPRRWRRRRPPGRAAPGRCTGACSARRGRGPGPARSPGPAR